MRTMKMKRSTMGTKSFRARLQEEVWHRLRSTKMNLLHRLRKRLQRGWSSLLPLRDVYLGTSSCHLLEDRDSADRAKTVVTIQVHQIRTRKKKKMSKVVVLVETPQRTGWMKVHRS